MKIMIYGWYDDADGDDDDKDEENDKDVDRMMK